MSWNVNFYMASEKDLSKPYDYLCYIKNLFLEDKFFKLVKFYINNRTNYFKYQIYEHVLNNQDGGFDRIASQAQIQLKDIDNTQVIFRVDVDVARMIDVDDSRGNLTFSDDYMRTSFYFKGINTSWNPAKNNIALQLVWQVGSHHYYNKHVYEPIWRENAKRVSAELKSMITHSDIKEIWGAEESFNGDPDNAFLLYKRDARDILLEIGVEQSEENINSLNDAFILLEDDYDIECLGNGILVVSKDFINGDLKLFFDSINEFYT